MNYTFEEGSAGMSPSGAGSIIDSSGNGYNADPIGDPNYQTVAGSLGLEFDGVDDYLFVPDQDDFAITDELALEATIRVDSLSSTKQLILFRGDGRGGLDPYTLFVRPNGLLRFQIKDEKDNGVSVDSANAVVLGEVLNVRATFSDQDDEMKIFVNGDLAGSKMTALAPFGALDQARNAGLGIGSRQDGSDDFFDGFIDNVRISNSVVAVPEPSAALLLFSGTALLAARRRRNR